MVQRIIVFLDMESYVAEIKLQKATPMRSPHYEVKVDDGVSTGEADPHTGLPRNNPIFSLTFPSNSVDEAATEFVKRIEKIRIEHGYYDIGDDDVVCVVIPDGFPWPPEGEKAVALT